MRLILGIQGVHWSLYIVSVSSWLFCLTAGNYDIKRNAVVLSWEFARHLPCQQSFSEHVGY